MKGNFDQLLYTKCQEYQPDFMKVWETLVNIDTATGYGEGLTQGGEFRRRVPAGAGGRGKPRAVGQAGRRI